MKTKVLIIVDGGVVQTIVSNGSIEITLADFDVPSMMPMMAVEEPDDEFDKTLEQNRVDIEEKSSDRAEAGNE